MKKRRSTVFVRPGKDVTLYVPSDTPPEVIDYMNRLKAEGLFSQGVMELIVNAVMREGAAPGRLEFSESGRPLPHPEGWTRQQETDVFEKSAGASERSSRDEGGMQHSRDVEDAGYPHDLIDAAGIPKRLHRVNETDRLNGPEPSEVAYNGSEDHQRAGQAADERKKFSLAQIFRQSRANAGKLAPVLNQDEGNRGNPSGSD